MMLSFKRLAECMFGGGTPTSQSEQLPVSPEAANAAETLRRQLQNTLNDQPQNTDAILSIASGIVDNPQFPASIKDATCTMLVRHAPQFKDPAGIFETLYFVNLAESRKQVAPLYWQPTALLSRAAHFKTRDPESAILVLGFLGSRPNFDLIERQKVLVELRRVGAQAPSLKEGEDLAPIKFLQAVDSAFTGDLEALRNLASAVRRVHEHLYGHTDALNPPAASSRPEAQPSIGLSKLAM